MDNTTESEQKQYKLRSRSRSRSETPLIFSRPVTEDDGSEHQYDLRPRSRERSMTPGEVSSSRRSSSRSIPSSVVKVRNRNMDTITEQNFDILEEAISNIKNASVEAELNKITLKKSERRSERQKLKKQTTANGQIGTNTRSNNQTHESQERRRSSTVQKNLTSDYSSEEGDREEGLSRANSAFEFYKQQGDYWNKFPKTDYTYSLASTCRYEVAPGVMAIPNMSRRSLHSDTSFYGSQTSDSQSSKESFNEEDNTMNVNSRRSLRNAVPQVLPHVRGSGIDTQEVIYSRTHVENHTVRRNYEFDSNDSNPIHERYEKWADPLLKSHPFNRYRSSNNLDSDSDYDEAVTKLKYKHKAKSTWQLSKLSSFMSTWFYTVLHFITLGHYGKHNSATSHYYRRHEETRWHRLQQRIDTILQYVYLFLVQVALFDSWILSRVSSFRNKFEGRHRKIFWIVLLPFLLAAACCVLPYASSVIPSVPSFNLTWLERDTLFVQRTTREDSQSNEELKKTIDLLLHRIQRLEADQSEKFSNVSRVLEELSQSDNQIWRHYDEKVVNLEQALENQKNHKEKCQEKSEEFNSIKMEFQTIKNLYSELRSCCDQTSNSIDNEEIRKQAEEVFTGYFGDAGSKDDVLKMFQIINSKIHQEELQKNVPLGTENSDKFGLGVEEIRKIVLGILKIYDADKTGQVDYALESAGGQVISTRCTQLYDIKTRAFKIFGMTLYYESNNPRTVIQGNTLQPGMCWAFQDFPGYLLVKLRSLIYVTGFTVEHASRLNLPNGEMKSAPKKFNVWGLQSENDVEPVMFGEYEFVDSDESIQYFPVQNTSITSAFEYVEMRIHSNHGQLEYTCLYRFRVHGNLA